jgi:hypothetical protein
MGARLALRVIDSEGGLNMSSEQLSIEKIVKELEETYRRQVQWYERLRDIPHLQIENLDDHRMEIGKILVEMRKTAECLAMIRTGSPWLGNIDEIKEKIAAYYTRHFVP